jgi:hypothetical protein
MRVAISSLLPMPGRHFQDENSRSQTSCQCFGQPDHASSTRAARLPVSRCDCTAVYRVQPITELDTSPDVTVTECYSHARTPSRPTACRPDGGAVGLRDVCDTPAAAANNAFPTTAAVRFNRLASATCRTRLACWAQASPGKVLQPKHHTHALHHVGFA